MKHKNLSVLIGILFISLHTAIAQSPLFDDSYLHEIRITSTEPDFWQILDDEYNDFLVFGTPIPYHSVTVEVDGNILENVGIRQKGFFI